MAAVLSLAFVLFGGMIFFAVCGMLIERWWSIPIPAPTPATIRV